MPIMAAELAIRVQAQIGDAEQDLRRIGQRVDDTATAVRKSSGGFADFGREVVQAAARGGTSVDDFKRTTRGLDTAFDAAGAEARTFGNRTENAANAATKEVKQLERQVDDVGDTARRAADNGSFLGRAFSIATGGAILGGIQAIGGALTGVFSTALGEATDATAGMAQLDAVLTSTAGKAGVTRDQVLDLASSLSAAGGLSKATDDAILQGENLLLTFTNVGAETFPRATKAMLDMATALAPAGSEITNMSAQAQMLGKSLNDPVRGVAALSKVGVTFTQEQKETIKALVDTGRAAQAQSLILSELESEFGGSAAAAAKATGQMMTIRETFNGVAEGVGAKLLPAIQKVTGVFASEQGRAAIQRFGDILATGVGGAVDLLTDKLIPAGMAVYNFAKSIGDSESTAGKAFDLIQKVGIPAIIGLSAAFVVQAIPSLLTWVATTATAVTSSTALTTALTTALGPIGLLTIAVAGTVAIYREWNKGVTAAAEGMRESSGAYQLATKALSDYNAMADFAKDATSGHAAAVRLAQLEVERYTTYLAREQELGQLGDPEHIKYLKEQLAGANVELYNAVVALEKQSSAYSDTSLHAYDAIESTRLMTAAQGPLSTAIALTSEQIDGIEKALTATAQAGGTAFASLVSSTAGFYTTLQESQTTHNQNMAGLEQERKQATTDVARQAVDEKIAKEQEGYATSLQNAALAYANEQAALRANLGEQLIIRATALAEQNNVSQAALDEFTGLLAREYGVAESSTALSFSRMQGSMDTWAASGGENAAQIVTDMGLAQDKAVELDLATARLQKEITTKLTADYQAGVIGIDTYRSELDKVPAQVQVVLTTLAHLEGIKEARREVDNLRAALGNMPTGKLVQIDAKLDPELRHRSPSPLEQEMAAIEAFASKRHIFDISIKNGRLLEAPPKYGADDRIHIPTPQDGIIRTTPIGGNPFVFDGRRLGESIPTAISDGIIRTKPILDRAFIGIVDQVRDHRDRIQEVVIDLGRSIPRIIGGGVMSELSEIERAMAMISDAVRRNMQTIGDEWRAGIEGIIRTTPIAGGFDRAIPTPIPGPAPYDRYLPSPQPNPPRGPKDPLPPYYPPTPPRGPKDPLPSYNANITFNLPNVRDAADVMREIRQNAPEITRLIVAQQKLRGGV